MIYNILKTKNKTIIIIILENDWLVFLTLKKCSWYNLSINDVVLKIKKFEYMPIIDERDE
jgi:hypothetical protein